MPHDNLDQFMRDEIEQAAITAYNRGEIGPIQFTTRLRRAGLTPQAIELALVTYRPDKFKPFAV
jgi:hypothetical protein